MPRSLVDTNILVYAQDRNEPVKRAAAIDLIDRLTSANEFVLSVQCLNDFSSVGLGKTAAVVTVEASDVRPVGRREITHARELASG